MPTSGYNTVFENFTAREAAKAAESAANSNTSKDGAWTPGKYWMFSDLKTPRDVSRYTLFRGTTDWTQLQQFDLFKQGYPYLIMVSAPYFLEKMAQVDNAVATLLASYKHIIECEFLGFDSGLQNIEAETQDISNGQQSVNLITKTNAPSGMTFSMSYREKAGGTITKMHELYLRSVSDTATTFKTYNGLIGAEGGIDPRDAGFHQECFSFLYMHTDDTGLLLERAAYLTCCQPTTAQLDIYNGKHGEVQFQDVSVEYTGFPIMSATINKKAQEILDWMNNEAKNTQHVTRNSWGYDYAGISDAAYGLNQASLVGNS